MTPSSRYCPLSPPCVMTMETRLISTIPGKANHHTNAFTIDTMFMLEKKKEKSCIAKSEKHLRVTNRTVRVVHSHSDWRVGSEGRRGRWGTPTMHFKYVYIIESRPTQGPSWGYFKIDFYQVCQLLTTIRIKMAPRTGKRLQNRGWDTPRRAFCGDTEGHAQKAQC